MLVLPCWPLADNQPGQRNMTVDTQTKAPFGDNNFKTIVCACCGANRMSHLLDERELKLNHDRAGGRRATKLSLATNRRHSDTQCSPARLWSNWKGRDKKAAHEIGRHHLGGRIRTLGAGVQLSRRQGGASSLLLLLLLGTLLAFLTVAQTDASVGPNHANELFSPIEHRAPTGARLGAADDGPPTRDDNPNGSNDDEATTTSQPASTTREQSSQFTKIPAASQQTVQTPAPTTRRPQMSKRTPIFRISETELLPFSEFNVHQPAFSDLMRSWPPTTRQHALAIGRAPSEAQRQLDAGPPPANQHHRRPSSGARRASGRQHDQDDTADQLMRNHLNEDLDDTIVTADESFEQDQLAEPPTWVNYLGDLGDFIYVQLRQFFEQSTKSPFWTNTSQQQQQPNANNRPSARLETIDDLLDDFYYDQYENSQVLYYGPQLVREGDIFEIGCYLSNDQPAEWTKSGKLLASASAHGTSGNGSTGTPNSAAHQVITEPNGPPRITGCAQVRRTLFLGAKQNYSLKISEATLGDTGNYRCTRMSRKFHKLVVVPKKISTGQLYMIQQRLLSVVNPKLASQAPGQAADVSAYYSARLGPAGGPASAPRPAATIEASGSSGTGPGSAADSAAPSPSAPPARPNKSGQGGAPAAGRNHILPGHLIVEQQPLLVACNITDEFILRRLRENPQFQLAWYKNGKLLRSSQPTSGAQSGQSVAARMGATNSPRPGPAWLVAPPVSSQRLQFLGPNGRQLYISSPTFADAGDYLCSWSRLPSRQVSARGARAHFRSRGQHT